MIKSRGADGETVVTFTLDPRVGAQVAVVYGDWNDWAPDIHVMERDDSGGFSLTVALESGRRYRFRYLLDRERWENDWAADAYEPNAFGEEDSIVDLTAGANGVYEVASAPPTSAPPTTAAAGKGAPRKAAPKNAAVTKTAAKTTTAKTTAAKTTTARTSTAKTTGGRTSAAKAVAAPAPPVRTPAPEAPAAMAPAALGPPAEALGGVAPEQGPAVTGAAGGKPPTKKARKASEKAARKAAEKASD